MKRQKSFAWVVWVAAGTLVKNPYEIPNTELVIEQVSRQTPSAQPAENKCAPHRLEYLMEGG